MKTPFHGETCLNQASLSTERTCKNQGSEKSPHCEDVANNDSDNCIACPKEDKPMQTDLKSTLSTNDVQYIRNLLAEGIARMLVKKVAKNTVSTVDSLESERYNAFHPKEEVP